MKDLETPRTLGEIMRSPKLWVPIASLLIFALLFQPWKEESVVRNDKMASALAVMILVLVAIFLIEKIKKDLKDEKLRRQHQSWQEWTHPK